MRLMGAHGDNHLAKQSQREELHTDDDEQNAEKQQGTIGKVLLLKDASPRQPRANATANQKTDETGNPEQMQRARGIVGENENAHEVEESD